MRSLWGALVLSSILLPFGGGAHRRTEEGNRHYLEGRYEEALRSYTEAQVQSPQAAELYYDIGNVLYRQGDFEGAAEAYSRALLQAPEGLVGAAAYNLGNARYRLEEFRDAVEAYERALRADPTDPEAKRNLELALRARHKQQQQQQPQQAADPQREEEEEGEEQQQQQQQQQPQEQEEGQDEEREAPQPPAAEDAVRQAPDAMAGAMSEEDARRLLDGLEEQELENLRNQALQRRPARGRTTEEDW